MGSAVTLTLQHSNVHPCRSEGLGVCWTPSYQYATASGTVPSTDGLTGSLRTLLYSLCVLCPLAHVHAIALSLRLTVIAVHYVLDSLCSLLRVSDEATASLYLNGFPFLLTMQHSFTVKAPCATLLTETLVRLLDNFSIYPVPKSQVLAKSALKFSASASCLSHRTLLRVSEAVASGRHRYWFPLLLSFQLVIRYMPNIHFVGRPTVSPS